MCQILYEMLFCIKVEKGTSLLWMVYFHWTRPKSDPEQPDVRLFSTCWHSHSIQLRFDDLQDFIDCYNPENRHLRKETKRFKYFKYQELIARDKTSLDIFWLKDDSLDDLDNLPPPEILQQEIIEHLEAALRSFRDVAAGLESTRSL